MTLVTRKDEYLVKDRCVTHPELESKSKSQLSGYISSTVTSADSVSLIYHQHAPTALSIQLDCNVRSIIVIKLAICHPSQNISLFPRLSAEDISLIRVHAMIVPYQLELKQQIAVLGEQKAFQKMFVKATALRRQGDNDCANAYYAVLANHGYCDAATYLAKYYQQKKSVGIKQIVKWLKIGVREKRFGQFGPHNFADRFAPDAAKQLGVILSDTAPDKAEKWFKKAIHWGRTEVYVDLHALQFKRDVQVHGKPLAMQRTYAEGLKLQKEGGLKSIEAESIFKVLADHRSMAASFQIGMILSRNNNSCIALGAIKYLKYASCEHFEHKGEAAYTLWQLLRMENLYKAVWYLTKALEWGSKEASQDIARFRIPQGVIEHYQKHNEAVLQSRIYDYFWMHLKSEIKATVKMRIETVVITAFKGSLLQIATNCPYNERLLIAARLKWSEVQVTEYFEKEKLRILAVLIKNKELSDKEIVASPFPVKGCCAGMVIDLFTSCFQGDWLNMQQTLLDKTKRYFSESGMGAITLQQIVESLDRPAIHFHTSVANNPHEETQKNVSEQHAARTAFLCKMQGLKWIPMPQLGIPGCLKDKDYLEKWLKEADGYYFMVFQVNATINHAVALIKKMGSVYLWDPNYGLIKCASDKPIKTLVRYLSHYYKSGIDSSNHHLDISRILPIIDFEFQEIAAKLGKCEAALQGHEMGRKNFSESNYLSARRWFELAAEQGHCEAALFAGNIWLEGPGKTPKSTKQATKYFEMATYEEGPIGASAAHELFKLSEDFEAKQWMDQAACWREQTSKNQKHVYECQAKFEIDCKQLGKANAMITAYERAKELSKRDPALAKCWFELVADAGHLLAAIEAGRLNCTQLTKNKFAAVKYLQMAVRPKANRSCALEAASILSMVYQELFYDAAQAQYWTEKSLEWEKEKVEAEIT